MRRCAVGRKRYWFHLWSAWILSTNNQAQMRHCTRCGYCRLRSSTG